MKNAVSVYFASALAVSGCVLCAHTQASQTPDKANQNALSNSDTTTQTVEPLINTNTNAQQAPQQLKGLLADMTQFRANFSQKVMDAQQNVVHEAQGVLTMTRPNKLRWETSFPDETLLVADGEAVWNVDEFVEQVTVMAQASAIKDNPIVLLTATDDVSWDKFSIVELLVAQDNQSQGNSHSSLLRSFQVTPKETGGQIVTLTLTFNEQHQLAAMNMLDAQQQISTLLFSDIETRFPLAADTFVVNIPESYIVDDQR